MFGGKNHKKTALQIDITRKRVKTWWGGAKLVPTTKKEQKLMKDYLQKKYPEYIVVDTAEKKRLQCEAELRWIDEVEALDALLMD